MPIILRIRKFFRFDKLEISRDNQFESNLALFINEVPAYHTDEPSGCFGPSENALHFSHYPVFGHY